MKNETNQERFNQVCLLDVCMSDYFSGYSYPVCAVPVFNGMTTHDLADGIQSEINGSYDMFVSEDGNAFTEAEMDLFDTYCADLKAKPATEFIGANTYEESEDSETAYAYLSLCKPVTRYGMTFLNA